MTRRYELKKRAESQAQTRQRIVDAAVQLHRTQGPAHTSLSDVARLAGVQRHTLYRHFPDERQLLLACSGHFYETNPPPDPGPWIDIADAPARLRTGLTELYEYYERGSEMIASVLRDAEIHPLTREMREHRSGESMKRIWGALADGLPQRKRAPAALGLALDFRTWQSLVQLGGLSNADAAETMVAAILAQ
jgi:AcrR family transcriptional regulator